MTREPECDQRLLDILRDVWFQFSLEKRVRWLHVSEPGRWAGGLSVLEDVEHELRAAGMIDEFGLEVKHHVRRVSETPEPGPDVMWLVLQYPKGYTPDVEIGGIFRTEAAAVAAATGELDVVGPVALDVKQPDVVWSGAYYPNLGNARFTNSGRSTAKVEVVGPTYDEMLLALGRCRSVMPYRPDLLDEERG